MLAPPVRRFLTEVAEGVAGELIAAAVPGAGIVALVGRHLGIAGAKGVASWFFSLRIAEQQAVLDGVAAVAPGEAAAIAADAVGPLHLESEIVDIVRRYVAAVPHAVRAATQLPADGGVSRMVPSQLPANDDELQRFLPPALPALAAGHLMPGAMVLERLLGQGGFGEVWLARNRHVRSRVQALKICLDETLQISLKRETDLLDRILEAGGHLNIVGVEGANLDHDPPYLALEFVPDGDLIGWAAGFKGDVPHPAVVEALWQMGEGLAFAHRLGIVHRDMKPANVLVDGTTFKIADLGIGTLIERASGNDVGTRSALSQAITPDYADPWRAWQNPKPASDIYALGLIGIQLLLGDVLRPVPQDWRNELQVREVPETLIALLDRCVARRGRPADGGEFVSALASLMQVQGVSASEAPDPFRQDDVDEEPAAEVLPPALVRGRLWPFGGRRVAVGLLLTVVLSIGFGIVLYLPEEASKPAEITRPSSPTEGSPTRVKTSTFRTRAPSSPIRQNDPGARSAAMPLPPQRPAPRTPLVNAEAPIEVRKSGAPQAALYEEGGRPGEQGSALAGTVSWSMSNEAFGGNDPESVVRANIAVPGRMMVTITIRKNTDSGLPASHVIEIQFATPDGFEGGGIKNVPGVVMKETEDAVGDALRGAAARVSAGLFWIALSQVEADEKKNLELLRTRDWVDVPILYENDRRAILTFSKGEEGRREIKNAFAASAR